jgi:hypothetical protein
MPSIEERAATIAQLVAAYRRANLSDSPGSQSREVAAFKKLQDCFRGDRDDLLAELYLEPYDLATMAISAWDENWQYELDLEETALSERALILAARNRISELKCTRFEAEELLRAIDDCIRDSLDSHRGVNLLLMQIRNSLVSVLYERPQIRAEMRAHAGRTCST